MKSPVGNDREVKLSYQYVLLRQIVFKVQLHVMIELTNSRRAADPEGAPVTSRVVPSPSASIVASAVPVVVAVPPEFPEVLGHAREVRDHLLWAFLRSAYIYQK